MTETPFILSQPHSSFPKLLHQPLWVLDWDRHRCVYFWTHRGERGVSVGLLPVLGQVGGEEGCIGKHSPRVCTRDNRLHEQPRHQAFQRVPMAQLSPTAFIPLEKL